MDAVTGRSYTYAEAKDVSKRFGSSLRKMGIQKGNVVAIFMPNAPDYITCLTGIIGGGAIATPINPNYTPFELAGQLQMTKASCIIVNSHTLETAKKAIKEIAGKFFNHIVLPTICRHWILYFYA